MTRKAIGIFLCLSFLFVQSRAQELGIEFSGGLQGTRYSLQNGQVTPLPGGSLGLSYSFRLGRNWNLLTGLAGGIYRTQAKLGDSAVFSSSQVDDEGSAFQYSAKATGYKETQQFMAGSIPLLLQYHTAGPGTRWYFNFGGRGIFPLNASIRQSAQQVRLSGYYPDYNIIVFNLPQHGFGTVNNWNSSQTVTLKPAAVLSAATGVSFRLPSGSRLYTGVYLDYGISALKSGGDSLPFVTYSPTGISQVRANSVLKMPGAGQMTLLAFGVQVKISFGSMNEKTKARPASKEAPKHPADTTISEYEIQVLQTPVVFGAVGETAIPDIVKDHLDDVAAILLQNPRIRISLVGHICNSGTETEDPEVGKDRANAVARYLADKGVSRRRMDISYIQKSDPVLPNNPAANYRNRRVAVTVQ